MEALEYDFSGVPEPELQSSCLYEYARESRAVLYKVEAVRKGRKESKADFRIIMVGNPIHTQILLALALTAEFPRLPWQRLPDGEKKRLAKLRGGVPGLAPLAQFAFKPPIILHPNKPGLPPFEVWTKTFSETCRSGPETKFGYFVIDGAYDEGVIVEQFTRQLRCLLYGTPLSEPFVPKPHTPKLPGRPILRDTLNALGAMRLRWHCAEIGKTFSYAKMKMKALKDKDNGMFYAHRESFNRAADSAVQRFQQFFKWIDSQPPIHARKP